MPADGHPAMAGGPLILSSLRAYAAPCGLDKTQVQVCFIQD